MGNKPSDYGRLSHVIHPVDVEQFKSDYWERQFLHIKRNDSSYFEQITDFSDIETIIACSGAPNPGAIKVIKTSGDSTIDIPVPLLENRSVDINSLYRLYLNGCTIVLNHLHATWPAIAVITKKLEIDIGHRITANLYCSPENTLGFSIHVDSHDVIVLQIAGEKRWKIYPAVKELVMSNEEISIEKADIGRPEVITVSAGDTLYIPRGIPHGTETNDDISVHLTCGIHLARKVDLLHKALDIAAADNVDFRKALPMGFNTSSQLDDIDSVKADISGLVAQCLDGNYIEQAIKGENEVFLQNRTFYPDGQFGALHTLEKISLNSLVSHREHIIFKFEPVSDHLALVFDGNSVQINSAFHSACHYICNNKVFVVRDIPADSDEVKVEITKLLIREGFLRARDESTGAI